MHQEHFGIMIFPNPLILNWYDPFYAIGRSIELINKGVTMKW